MKYQFANRASSHLSAPLPVDGEFVVVAPGQGDRFPAALVQAPFQLTVVAVDGSSEIMRCDNRSGDVLHVLRGQENTAVSAFDIGSLAELRLTAEVLNSFMTLGGGTMTGDVNFNGFSIISANLVGAPAIDFVKTNGVYPLDGNFAGAVEHLNGGIWPRHLGSTILTAAMLPGAVFPWWGRLDQLPPWFKLCDGTLGTPDLRGRFVLAAFNDSEIGTSGGQFRSATFNAGTHGHGGATGLSSIGAFNLPPVNLTLTSDKIGVLSSVLDPAFQPRLTFLTKVTGSVAYGSGTPSQSSHAHSISSDGDHAHAVDLVPPYFRLYYVMFRSTAFN